MIPPKAARSSHLNASSQDSPSQAGREPSYLNFRYYWNYQEFLRKLYPLFLSLKKKQFKDYSFMLAHSLRSFISKSFAVFK